ncbi:MAG: hypothetical protein ABJZ55_08885 [Fuerstiella sp.]
MTNAVEAIGSYLTAESASMNAPSISSSHASHASHASHISGALRYERVAILEAALTIKRQRNRQWWAKAFVSVGVIALTAVVFMMSIN